jgi:hypothetical protein
MLVSARGAAEILRGVGLGREDARHLLLAGFAGPGLRTRSALLYDEERVRSLTTRPWLDDDVIDEMCPFGMFVGRVARSRPIDVTGDPSALRDAVSRGWRVHLLSQILITTRIERYGPTPFLATMCGYVAVGADVVEVQADESGSISFMLTEPGAWFEPFDQRQVLAGAGRGCFIWGWPQQYRG